MKEKYTIPEMLIIEFNSEDVITTSLTNDGNAKDFDGNGDIQINV